jgi:hypothetical protein
MKNFANNATLMLLDGMMLRLWIPSAVFMLVITELITLLMLRIFSKPSGTSIKLFGLVTQLCVATCVALTQYYHH